MLRWQTRLRTRSDSRYWPTLCVTLAMTLGLGAACSSQTSGAAGEQLVWGTAADATGLDPAVTNTAISWGLIHLTYENLVGVDERLKVVPELAESWRQVSPTVYEFTLRKGVTFSNGRQLTADDVVGSLKRLTDPKLAALWASNLGEIRSVVKSGDRQVTVTLASPRSVFLPALAGSPAAVLPMKELEDGTFDPKKDLLGTGPFKVVAHSQDESWTLERNPHYWRPDVPSYDRLLVRIMPDDAARTAALRNGSIDVTTFDSVDSVRILKDQRDVTTVRQATTDYFRLDLNAKSSIFRDDRLRQAVALTIDREQISKVALGGIGRPTAAVSTAFGGICDPAALPHGKPDIERARQLVEAAGATGKTVEILTSAATPMSSPIAQVLQQNLQQAGLKVRIVNVEIGELLKRVFTGDTADFDLDVNWFVGYVDPAMVLPRYKADLKGFNKTWAKHDPQLGAAIDRSLATAPGPARTVALREACQQIAQSANIIPLVSKEIVVAYRPDRISGSIRPLEGYSRPLSNIAEFEVR
jgi:peptide/nickel transport system substrate-binding protein